MDEIEERHEEPASDNRKAVEEAREELRAEQERIEAAEAIAHEEGRRDAEREAAQRAEIDAARAETESVRAECAAQIAERDVRIGELFARNTELETRAAELAARIAELEMEEEELEEVTDAINVAEVEASETPPVEEHRLDENESPTRRKKKFVKLFSH